MEKYLINPNQKISKIHKDVYGHFSEHLGRCIYEGLYVGENSPIPNVNGMRTDVVNALREMGLPVLRWPGGCFADIYHWKDGIGPRDKRPTLTNSYWGGSIEDNSFGTHEFFELCRQIGCDPYVAGNLGSGTVQEMSEWVEYMTFDGVSPMAELRRENGQEKPWKVRYFGIGNENWGCGGNMEPEYYADLYRRYATYVRQYDADNRIQKIACGPTPYLDHCYWTEVLMKKAGPMMDGIALHYYAARRNPAKPGFSKALEFDEDEYYEIIESAWRMEELVTRQSEVMNRYDPEKRVSLVVDEWGIWHEVEEGTHPRFLYQQNAIRDAIVAGLTLNVFNKHADRVRMANLAQTVNVLQSVVLTDGEQMLLTPTYFVFKMYKEHQNSTLLGSYITTEKAGERNIVPQLIESASLTQDGRIIATIVNTSMTESAEISCQIADFAVKGITAEILTGEAHDHNTFENKDVVKTVAFDGFEATADGFKATLPACSVVKFVIA